MRLRWIIALAAATLVGCATPPPTAAPPPVKPGPSSPPAWNDLDAISRTEAALAASRADARQERIREQKQQTPPPTRWVDCGALGLPADLVMVCGHESQGNTRAYNPTGCVGGCYGLFQMSGEYMSGWAANAGHPNTAPGHWPTDLQVDVALWMYAQPGGLEAYWCRWTTYC
ncbi:MAG: hypothetical protein MUF33_02140 [Candidatus Nanopelagicales bacterium]|nr:hypothetical protein [Candidatus Nanopelagicales bacterium]